MVEVRWTHLAIDDLNEIGEYIAKDSRRYAEITVQELFDATEILEQTPKAGRIVPEFSKPNLRELIQGNYRIIYKIINTKTIGILTIHHAKRDIYSNKKLK